MGNWREAVRAKDGHRCVKCRRSSDVVLEVHHVVPKQHGGEDTLDNCITLCTACHSEWERWVNLFEEPPLTLDCWMFAVPADVCWVAINELPMQRDQLTWNEGVNTLRGMHFRGELNAL